MKQIGVIVERIGDKAKVKIQRHTACSKCGRCDGGLHRLESPRDLVVVVENPLDAQEGQVVQLETADRGVLWAAFLAYILPLINFFLGFWVGQRLAGYWGFTREGEVIGVVFAVLLLAATFLFLRNQEQKFAQNKSFQPVITSIFDD